MTWGNEGRGTKNTRKYSRPPERVRFKVMWSILLVAEFSEEKSDEFEESE